MSAPSPSWRGQIGELERLRDRMRISTELTNEVIAMAQKVVKAYCAPPSPGRDLRLQAAMKMLENLVGHGSHE